jgi:hypothetical protein
MHQLIILIPSGVNMISFDQGWPEFLAAAEQMPGLIRESLTRVDQQLYGTPAIQRIYCFDFPDQKTLTQGLVSQAGEKAGGILHRLTGGMASICTGYYQSDLLEHIRPGSWQQPNP